MRQIWGFVGCILGGLVIGITATFFAPRVIGPYLPSTFIRTADGIEGRVATKQIKGDRLILTILTTEGAILATFKKKVTEIDILVATGDRVTLARKGYQAFLEDPGIGRVRKKEVTPRKMTRGTLPPSTPLEPMEKELKKQVLQ